MRPVHPLLLLAVLPVTACVEPVLTQSNDPPLAVIRSPADGAVFDQGAPVDLQGEVTDDKNISALTVEWLDNGTPIGTATASVDDAGRTAITVADFDLGAHAISLRVVDGDNLSFEASVGITIVEAIVNPVLDIVRPAPGERGESGTEALFEVTVSDPQSPPDDLQVEVASDLDGFFCAFDVDPQGSGICRAVPTTAGDHRLTFSATDPEGNTRTRSTVWTVDAVPENPTIAITAPIAGTRLRQNATVSFEATVADRQDPPGNLTVDVSSDLDGSVCTPLADPSGAASCFGVLSTLGTHRLTFRVTDTDTNTSAAQALVQVVDGLDVDDDGDGFTENQGDCDDDAPNVNPNATELPNGVDDNCVDGVDEGTTRADDDGDGFCEGPVCSDGATPGDCNDTPGTGANAFPGATEQCSTPFDDNCNSQINENGAQGCTTYYADNDGDGFGDPATTVCSCAQPAGAWVSNDRDCSPGNGDIAPGKPELPNGLDDDCDTTIDEGTVRYDDDGDGYCEGPTCSDGSTPGDCDDGPSGAAINPGATEVCGNARDEDCSGNINDGRDDEIQGGDTFFRDNDNDGFGENGSARAYCPSSPNKPAAWRATVAGDCFDDNAFAYPGPRKPGDPQWFTSDRGDGSFDFNCDTTETERYPDEFECGCTIPLANGSSFQFEDFSPGWREKPECGAVGEFVQTCNKVTPQIATDTFEALFFGVFWCVFPIDFGTQATVRSQQQQCF